MQKVPDNRNRTSLQNKSNKQTFATRDVTTVHIFSKHFLSDLIYILLLYLILWIRKDKNGFDKEDFFLQYGKTVSDRYLRLE